MKKFALSVSLFLFLSISTSAFADITIERWTRSNFIIGFESTSTTKIQGLKQYSSSKVKFDSKLIAFFASDSPVVMITRIDKGVMWNLDTKKKTYTETPLAVMDLDKLVENEQKKSEADKSGETAKPEKQEKPKYKLIKSDFKVKKTGAKEEISGFACEEYSAIWTAVLENTETKGRLTEIFQTDLWTTPESGLIKQAQKEESEFNEALYKKLGMDEKLKAFIALLGFDKMKANGKPADKDLKKYYAEFSKIQGYPIRTIIKIQSIEDEKEKAARLKKEQQEQEALDKEKKEQEAQSESEDDTSITSTGDIFGSLSKLATKKVTKTVSDKQAEKQKQQKEQAELDRDKPIILFKNEVRKISADPVSTETFEIPAKYKLKRD